MGQTAKYCTRIDREYAMLGRGCSRATLRRCRPCLGAKPRTRVVCVIQTVVNRAVAKTSQSAAIQTILEQALQKMLPRTTQYDIDAGIAKGDKEIGILTQGSLEPVKYF